MQVDIPCLNTALCSDVSHTHRQRHLADEYFQGGSSGTINGASASNLAGRLHAMQADAMDRAWQKLHESQRLALPAAGSSLDATSAAAAAAPKLCPEPSPAGSLRVLDVSATVNVHALGHSSVVRQCQPVRSQQGQALSNSNRSAFNASRAAVTSAEPSMASSSQPATESHTHTTCKPAAGPKYASDGCTDAMPENHGADLSRETESLVAKLRALSQGRSDSTRSKASAKVSGQQEQRYPFASRATNTNQPKPIMADPRAPPPPPKRCKQGGMHTAGAATSGHVAASAVDAASQPRPNTARCIQLMEPVHSGTDYGSGPTSPQRRSHRLQSRAASPAAGNRLRSGYASVAAPIQLSAPMEQPPAAAVPTAPTAPLAAPTAASAAAGAAPSRVHQQQAPASPVQHRLGKPTPLKKGFTPKPTRFRLEAERLSLTPPDKSSGLEKVLFRSPVKAAAASSTLNQGCSNDVIASASCHAAVAPEARILVMHEAEQGPHATQAVPGVSGPCTDYMAEAEASQAMVTPANGCIPGVQADRPVASQGVFAHMKVILDPELSPEESHRYG